jgi:HD-like signal output (HDOD) protein
MPTLDIVCAKALKLPCSPALLPRLIKVLENPDSDVADLVQLIQLDPALAASTVRLANSAYFSGGVEAGSVADAVMRLGVRELYRLAALSLAARWMTIEVSGYSWEAGDFCRASVIKALAAELLAEKTGLVSPALAYTAGLVHELGKLAVAFSCSAEIPAVRARQVAENCPWVDAENAVLGFNHTMVTGRLLTEWRFPTACIAVAVHAPDAASMPGEHLALAAHVHAAHYLAVTLGAGQGEDGFLYTMKPDIMEKFSLDASTLEQTLPDVLERATRLLGEGLTHGPIKS